MTEWKSLFVECISATIGTIKKSSLTQVRQAGHVDLKWYYL